METGKRPAHNTVRSEVFCYGNSGFRRCRLYWQPYLHRAAERRLRCGGGRQLLQCFPCGARPRQADHREGLPLLQCGYDQTRGRGEDLHRVPGHRRRHPVRRLQGRRRERLQAHRILLQQPELHAGHSGRDAPPQLPQLRVQLFGHRLRRPRLCAHHRGFPRWCHHQPLRHHQGLHRAHPDRCLQG